MEIQRDFRDAGDRGAAGGVHERGGIVVEPGACEEAGDRGAAGDRSGAIAAGAVATDGELDSGADRAERAGLRSGMGFARGFSRSRALC